MLRLTTGVRGATRSGAIFMASSSPASLRVWFPPVFRVQPPLKSISRTVFHTHTQTYTRTHINLINPPIQRQRGKAKRTHAHAQAQAHAPPHTLTHTHTHIYTHTQARGHTHEHIHAHTHTRTHAHTHPCTHVYARISTHVAPTKNILTCIAPIAVVCLCLACCLFLARPLSAFSLLRPFSFALSLSLQQPTLPRCHNRTLGLRFMSSLPPHTVGDAEWLWMWLHKHNLVVSHMWMHLCLRDDVGVRGGGGLLARRRRAPTGSDQRHEEGGIWGCVMRECHRVSLTTHPHDTTSYSTVRNTFGPYSREQPGLLTSRFVFATTMDEYWENLYPFSWFSYTWILTFSVCVLIKMTHVPSSIVLLYL